MVFSGFRKPDSMTNGRQRQGVRNVESAAVRIDEAAFDAVVLASLGVYTLRRSMLHVNAIVAA
jgi:hypothetical protein